MVSELRQKLHSMGISVPKSFNATALRQLYYENVEKANRQETNLISREKVELGGCDVTETIISSGEPSQSGSTSVNNASDNLELLSTLQMMAQSCSALQQTVNTLLEKDKKTEENPLQKVMTNAERGTSGTTPSIHGQIQNTVEAIPSSCTQADEKATPVPPISLVMWNFSK
ncbi:uncharacterized protein LOC134276681 [Saccostrea cucullata]|uniref:uncharacterized protein LOC134276681 n=1 Tax=Saccostrea cuccullata TaxID=36930 RepID=UPI002ED0FCB3